MKLWFVVRFFVSQTIFYRFPSGTSPCSPKGDQGIHLGEVASGERNPTSMTSEEDHGLIPSTILRKLRTGEALKFQLVR